MKMASRYGEWLRIYSIRSLGQSKKSGPLDLGLGVELTNPPHKVRFLQNVTKGIRLGLIFCWWIILKWIFDRTSGGLL
jgi:hypothetical protein